VKAIEFYSGIGAFAEAVRELDLQVIAAFDQNSAANSVYEFNFGLAPSNRNLDSIKIDQIPPADLWWMSPPCTPFSVRGKRRDLDDRRAASLKRLVDFAVVLQPPLVMIENVLGFRGSQAELYVRNALEPLGYHLRTYDLCSTQFGVPMRRPRYYLTAVKRLGADIGTAAGSSTATESVTPYPVPSDKPTAHLREFLFEHDDSLVLLPKLMERYGKGFDIVDPDDQSAELICFTKHYARCMRASGSLVKSDYGIRRVSPEEILRLLGFSQRFVFPASIDRETRWRLVGNSVDVQAINFLLGQSCKSTTWPASFRNPCAPT
jgi:DNA (cytosine-5)-methyltransferase 1